MSSNKIPFSFKFYIMVIVTDINISEIQLSIVGNTKVISILCYTFIHSMSLRKYDCFWTTQLYQN